MLEGIDLDLWDLRQLRAFGRSARFGILPAVYRASVRGLQALNLRVACCCGEQCPADSAMYSSVHPTLFEKFLKWLGPGESVKCTGYIYLDHSKAMPSFTLGFGESASDVEILQMMAAALPRLVRNDPTFASFQYHRRKDFFGGGAHADRLRIPVSLMFSLL